MKAIKPTNHTKLCDQFKLEFILLFSDHEYCIWLDSVLIYKIDIANKKIVLIAPNFFVLKYIENNYLDFISNFYKIKYNTEFEVKLSIEKLYKENLVENRFNINLQSNINNAIKNITVDNLYNKNNLSKKDNAHKITNVTDFTHISNSFDNLNNLNFKNTNTLNAKNNLKIKKNTKKKLKPFINFNIKEKFDWHVKYLTSKIFNIKPQSNLTDANSKNTLCSKKINNINNDNINYQLIKSFNKNSNTSSKSNMQKEEMPQEIQKKTKQHQNNIFTKSANSIYNFENFIIGKTNKLAYYSAFAVANSKDINKVMPLFIYGPVGVGKTHLVNAIFNYINANFSNKKVLYTSGQEFIYEFVKALQNKKIMEFKAKFHDINVLIIDDLQLISSAVNSQIEFLNIIDNLMQSGKQLIVCANKSAYKLDNIQEQIKSRLGCGLVVEITLPDYELRLAILKAKALEHKAQLSDNIIEFLATNLITSVREIEAALNKILTYQKVYNSIVKLSDVKLILKDLINEDKKVISINEIIKYTSEYFHIRYEDILSNDKYARFAKPRQVAIYIIKELTQENLKKIATIFNKKDHTSILYAIKSLTKLKQNNKQIEQDIANIINYFK